MTDLSSIAARMTSGGRGILAADESIKTMSSRLEGVGVDGTDTNRRDYREVLVTAAELSVSVSGVILCDETFRQQLSDGRTFPQACRDADVLPGIKVDAGTSPLPRQGGALVTEGLDKLGARMEEYAAAGAAFAKWRAVVDPATTTAYARQANAHALARYAALCQEHGVVPIVEPEVLCSGRHDITRSADVTRETLAAVFDELERAQVDLPGIVLKPNFVTPGLDAAAVDAREVAQATYDVLRATVPADVTGIAFLSGGHPTDAACGFLREINDIPDTPWNLTFSFGRALVSDALATWRGAASNADEAQQALLRNCAAASASTLHAVA